jgi:hypothetical protein
MTTSTFATGFAGALTATALWAAAAGEASATTITLTDPPTQSDTLMTVVFKATAAVSFVIDEGYQVNAIEKLTDNKVTLSGGGPNLLGPTWQSSFAAMGSDSYTFNDGTPVPALGFAAQDPPFMDAFIQKFATTPGDTYVYTFNYWNNTAGFAAAPSKLVVTAASVPETSTWAMLLLGFAGLGLAMRQARRAAASALVSM